MAISFKRRKSEIYVCQNPSQFLHGQFQNLFFNFLASKCDDFFENFLKSSFGPFLLRIYLFIYLFLYFLIAKWRIVLATNFFFTGTEECRSRFFSFSKVLFIAIDSVHY